jgi:hypothetical protein
MSRHYSAAHLMYTLTGVAIVGVAAVAGVTAFNPTADTKPDYSIGISPTSANVLQGGTASYGVTLAGGSGWTGSTPISLSTSGLPKGASACFVVGSAPCATTANSSTASTNSITVQVTAGATTATGSSTFSVNANGANQKHSATGTLVVNAAARFSLGISPTSVTVEAGGTATLAVSIARSGGFTGAVTLSAPDLPKNVTATFSPAVPTGDTSTMTISAASNASVATSSFTVTGTATGQSTQYAGGQLTVAGATKRAFTVNGSLTGVLSPGAMSPIDLAIDNSANNQDLAVDNLTVSLTSVTPAADAIGTCTTADFTVVPYRGAYPLTVPAGATRHLSDLNVGVEQQPALHMLDTSLNQDGCKNARVSLSYTGTGHGG